MTQIELTQAELDLIQAKREEDQVKEQKKQERINEDIVKAEARIDKRRQTDLRQDAAANDFLKELGEGWVRHVDTNEWTEKVYWGAELVWSKIYHDTRVSLINGAYKVRVEDYVVYSGWRGGQNKGYKMFLSGPDVEYRYNAKALSKASTVNKKVQECIEAIKSREDHKKKKASAVETAVHDLQVAYPNAKVIAIRDWTRGYSTKNAYREYDKVTIAFPNGIQVAYEVYADGRMSRLNVDFGGLENNELLNLLSEVPMPISE
jgi:hypothetical protein